MQDKIIIAGLDYDIKEEKDLARDHNALGMHSGNAAEIKIDTDLKECIKRKVLLHEILEAINYEYELKLEHNILSILESSLFSVLKSNSWLANYLNGDYNANNK